MQDKRNKNGKELKKIIQTKVFKESSNGSNSFTYLNFKWIFDFRNIFLNAEHLDLISEIFWEEYKSKYPFQVGGLETASIPLVAGIVMKSKEKNMPINGFYIRKSRKGVGLMNTVEGKIGEEKIILVDDLIDSGKSFTYQVEVLEKLEKKVDEIFTLINFREIYTYKFASERGIKISSLFGLPEFNIKYKRDDQGNVYDIFTPKWCFKSLNPNYSLVGQKSCPVIDKTKLYFGGDNGTFWAINQKNGSVAWKFKTSWQAKNRLAFSSPAIHKDTIFTISQNGNVYAFDLGTGRKKWVFKEADWLGSSPMVVEKLGMLFVALQSGLFSKRSSIVALDTQTGEKKWEYGISDLIFSTPAYSHIHGIICVGSDDGTVHTLKAKSGKLIWTFKANARVRGSFLFDKKSEYVYFGSFDGTLYMLDTKMGTVVNTYKSYDAIYSTPVMAKNALLFSSTDKNIYSVNSKTLTLNWTFKTQGKIMGSPLAVEDKLYIGSNDGRFYEINLETGKQCGFAQFSERITNAPVYNAETHQFFVSTFANEIYCLKKKVSRDNE